MILTCPECASRYFVEDSALSGEGRKVRCTSCGASWTAAAPPPLELRATEAGALGVEPAADAELAGDDLSKAFRARVQERGRIAEAAATGAVWAGLGAAFAALIALSLVFRVDVVRAFPKAASAYAAVGLPVNRIGLVIEKVEAQPALQDGRAALTVSGVVRNIRGEAVAPPPLSIALIDKSGAKLKTAKVQPGEVPIPARGTRPFTVSVLEPPPAAADVEVTFSLDRTSGPKRVKAAHAAGNLGLRPARAAPPAASIPVPEAKPLSADSEYAIAPTH